MVESTDSPGKRVPAGLLFPGLILLSAAIYGYFTFRPPLRSSRPESPGQFEIPPPASSEGIRSEHARLWEDPFSYAYGHAGDKPERGLRGWMNRAGLADGEHDQHVAALQEHFLKLIKNDSVECLTVMPVIVPGGPYTDDKEQRRRIRYAMIAGLYTAGYSLKFPQRLSYVEIPLLVDLKAVDEVRPFTLQVPIKLYGKNKERVLVCWLNESHLGNRPLCAIGQVLEGLFGKAMKHDDCKTKLLLSIIGPANSDMLNAMDIENKNWLDWHPAETWTGDARYGEAIDRYKAATAAGFFNRFNNERASHGHLPATIFSPRATMSKKVEDFDNAGLKLVRTIGTDALLFTTLIGELKLRRAWPENDGPNHLVLLTERDTLYGRSVKGTLEDWADQSVHDRFHHITFMRGIDGRIPGTKATDGLNQDESQDTTQEAIPVGKSQFDYLRRLELQLVALESQLRRGGRGNEQITAIGIVGTDLYDKLLILRSLRNRFPQAWFFTTDLDARFSHASEFDYARNLIIASHFSLELHPSLQNEVPPFRDSYQTSTFFACRLALRDAPVLDALRLATNNEHDISNPWGLHDDAVEPKHRLQPLTFEVGRRRPYQLTVTEAVYGTKPGDGPTVSSNVHPASPREHPWFALPGRVGWMLLAGVGIVLTLALNITAVRKMVASTLIAPVRVPASLLVLAVYLATLFRGSNAANLSANQFWEKCISLWNTGLRYVSRIKAEARHWRQSFHTSDWLALAGVVFGITLLIVIGNNHGDQSGEPFEVFEGISVWPSTLIRFAAALMSFAWVLIGWSDLQRNHERLSADLLVRSRLRMASPRRLRPCMQIRRFIRSELPYGWRRGETTVTRLFRRYSHKGSCPARCTRIALMAMAFSVFGWSLFQLSESPNLPFRGQASETIGQWILRAAVAGMILLIFFVMDATQLCLRFVRKLANDTKDWPAAAIQELNSERKCAAPNQLRELLMIRMIAKHTNVVGKLMLYPFAVVLLIILSRSSFFDNLDFPVFLVIILAILLLGLVLMYLRLRIEAAKARKAVLGRLENQLSAAMANQRLEGQIRQMMREIQQENDGAFRPLTQDWLFRALAIPFTGAGGLVLIESMLP